MTEPLLDLTTLAPDRESIFIDGQPYELIAPREASLRENAIIDRCRRALNLVSEQVDKTLTPEKRKQADKVITAALATAVRVLVPDAPDDVLAKLNDNQRLAIVQAFTRAARQKREATPVNRAERRRSRSTTGSSSPASAGSTAPMTGSA